MLTACSSSPPPIMPKQHVLTPFGTHDTLTHHDWQKEALTVEHAVTISLQQHGHRRANKSITGAYHEIGGTSPTL